MDELIFSTRPLRRWPSPSWPPKPRVWTAVLLLLATLVGCEPPRSPPPESASVLPVSAVLVQRQASFQYPQTFHGRLKAVQRATLSFEIAGRLQEVLVDEGESLDAGQTAARLDTALLDAQRPVLLAQRQTEELILTRLERGERMEAIRAAEAAVRRLEVERELAQAERARAETVFENRSISQSDYDKALSAFQAAEYSLEQARQRLEELVNGSREEDIQAQASRVTTLDARLQALDVERAKAALTVPFDSEVVQRYEDEGASISPGQPVLQVIERGALEARFSVPPESLETVKATHYLWVAGERHAVHSPRIVSQVDSVTRSVDVIFPLQQTDGRSLLPGSSCQLRIARRIPTPCFELPVSALVASVRGLWSCYRLRPENQDAETYRVERVEVSVLHTDGQRVVVEAALPEEALVVATGPHRLVPGVRVRIAGEDP